MTTKTKKLLGWILVGGPFAGLFILIGSVSGWDVVIQTVTFIMGVLAFIVVVLGGFRLLQEAKFDENNRKTDEALAHQYRQDTERQAEAGHGE